MHGVVHKKKISLGNGYLIANLKLCFVQGWSVSIFNWCDSLPSEKMSAVNLFNTDQLRVKFNNFGSQLKDCEILAEHEIYQ